MTRPSRIGPDGIYGQYLTYLLVVLPLAWLAIANLFKREHAQRSQTAQSEQRSHRVRARLWTANPTPDNRPNGR